MKTKIFMSMCLMGVLLVSFAGCSQAIEQGITYANSIDQSVQFPSSYRVTYQVTDGTGTITTMTKAQDAGGNIYYASGNEETLFMKDGDGYHLYERTTFGTFELESGGNVYSSTYVDEATAAFIELAEKSSDRFLPTVVELDASQVAGRDCETYQIEVGFAGFKQNYVFNVDVETGICLGWNEQTSAGSTILESEEPTFQCTEFVTANITLPEVA